MLRNGGDCHELAAMSMSVFWVLQLPLRRGIVGSQVNLLLLEAVWNQIRVRFLALLLGVAYFVACKTPTILCLVAPQVKSLPRLRCFVDARSLHDFVI